MKRLGMGGFSLLEMTVVLLILGLLMGGMLMPLQAQTDYNKRQQTNKALTEIKEALIGFSIINGRFPCPSIITDPANAGFGVEAVACSPSSVTRDGFLPWKSLGVSEADAWGVTQRESTGSMLGYWRYRVDRNFVVPFQLGAGFSTDALQIRNSKADILTTTIERPIAVIYSTGKNSRPDGENADYEASGGVYQSDVQSTSFDDMLIWITRPLLMNRMVSAGKLP